MLMFCFKEEIKKQSNFLATNEVPALAAGGLHNQAFFSKREI